MSNNNTVKWIVIIIAILISSIGVCFGVIKDADARDMEKYVAKIDSQYTMIMELKTQSAVIEVELRNLSKQVQDLTEFLQQRGD